MKKRFWLTVVCLVPGGYAAGYLAGLVSGPRQLQYWSVMLILTPLILITLVAITTVLVHGSREQQREFWSAMAAYFILGVLSVAAYVAGDSLVQDKLFDVFLFGQMVAFLSLLKTCFNAWANPTPRESAEERQIRIEEDKRIRSENWSKAGNPF